jgi:ABC-type phosphate transport system permease subunit
LALVAVPALVTALFALASFTYSEPPEPSVGMLWAGITVGLLTLPVVAGVIASRGRSAPDSQPAPRGWLLTAVAVTVLIAGWWLLQRVV